MNILDRWKAPTPKLAKQVITLCAVFGGGAAATLTLETLGGGMVPGFTFTLLPIVNLLAKNVLAATIVIGIMAKLFVEKSATELQKPE